MNLQDYASDDLDKLRQEQAAPAAAPVAPPPAPSPAEAALRNPDFTDYLAQRAQEISDAQKDANERQRWADLSNSFVKGSAALRGQAPDKVLLDANNEQAQRPLAQAMQRQASADAATKDYAAQQDITTKGNAAAWEAAKRDPNSSVSKTIQGIYAPVLGPAAAHLTAADAEAASAGGQLQISKIAETARAKQAQAELARQTAAQQETARHNLADESLKQQELGVQGKRFDQEQALKFNKPIEPQEMVKLNNQIQGPGALDELEQLHGKIGGGSLPNVIAGALPGNSAANQYGDALKAKAAAVAAAMLPAGRETPGAVEEQIKHLPSPYDSHARAQESFEHARETIINNAQAQLDSFKASGMYNKGQLEDLQNKLDTVKTKYAPKAGGAAPAAAASAPASAGPTHYLVSPDRKTRIPADATGKPLGPPEPNPNG